LNKQKVDLQLLPSIRRRYDAVELRNIQAADAR